MTAERRHVGTPEAARRVGVDRTTLYRWYQAGHVRPAQVTPGRKVRWDVADLRRQLDLPPEETTVTATTDDPVVAAIITCKHGVLLTRRHDGKPLWGFLSGEVEPGEAPTDTAVREAKEEAELAVAAGHMIGDRIHPRSGRHMIYMACLPVEGLDVNVGDEEELAEIRWVPNMAALLALVPREHLFDPVHEHLTRMLPDE